MLDRSSPGFLNLLLLPLTDENGVTVFCGFMDMNKVRFKVSDAEQKLILVNSTHIVSVQLAKQCHASLMVQTHRETLPADWCVPNTEDGIAMWYDNGELVTFDVGVWPIYWEPSTKVLVYAPTVTP